MDYPDALDRWWFDWVSLFPDLPFWNPYMACLLALVAIKLSLWLFHRVDRTLWRTSRREILPPE